MQHVSLCLCSLLAATSQFSIPIGQKMQLTGWENANNVRNATCVASKTSKVPTQDALPFISYSMAMGNYLNLLFVWTRVTGKTRCACIQTNNVYIFWTRNLSIYWRIVVLVYDSSFIIRPHNAFRYFIRSTDENYWGGGVPPPPPPHTPARDGPARGELKCEQENINYTSIMTIC